YAGTCAAGTRTGPSRGAPVLSPSLLEPTWAPGRGHRRGSERPTPGGMKLAERHYKARIGCQKAQPLGGERSIAMLLKEIMTPGVEVIAPDATIREAAEKMRHLDIGPLPVCDGDRLVGLLTDRDITVRAVADGRDPVTTRVHEVMTPDVVYGFDD